MTDVEFVRRLPVVMKEAAIAIPLVAAIHCEDGCVVAMMASNLYLRSFQFMLT